MHPATKERQEMTELVFQTRLSLLFTILLSSTLRRHNEQDDFAPVIHAAEFADFASNGVVGSVAHGRLCPSAYRGVPGSPSCRRIVGDTFQVRKLVGRLLGQDPPGDLNLRRRQSDLLEKRRQRFQARWCSKRTVPTASLLRPNVTEYSVVVRSIVGPAARSSVVAQRRFPVM